MPPALGAELSEGAKLAIAVEANVRWSMHQLLETQEAQNGLKNGIKLVGALYEIATGQIRFLP
jgi:carbonic anhydrase